jgi:muramoyltetrapeptide carboxypeptidase
MPGALEQHGWHAGSPKVRARDLQTAFADPDVDPILTMRGGYGSAQVIPLLDFDLIAETPKAFVGASDITALHAALLTYTGLATFYGPGLAMLGSPAPSSLTTNRLLQMLGGETTGPVPEDRDRLTVISVAGGKASGRLVGGCLVDFIYTLGTPWEPDLDGAIFFFEECNHAPIQIDRALLYLEQAGKFEGVRGIVVGELAGCEWYEHTSMPRSKTLEEVLQERLGRL